MDVLQPVEICLVEALRNKFQFAGFYCLNGRFCHLFHLYKPLLFDHGLYGGVAAVMGSYGMGMGNNFYQKTQVFQIFYHGFSGIVTVHAGVFAAFFVDGSVIVQDVDLFQVVTFSNLEVVGVMSRGDLYAAGSELFVYIEIADHRDLAVGEGELQHFSDEVLITLVIRVYCH